MNLETLLEVIQVQRHDFLNHLQVISGLLQLKKVDRVREYIGQISMEMAQLSQTTRMKLPEVTAALLAGFNEASKSQIDLELTVNSNLADCAVPGPVVGHALERSLNCAFATMASPEVRERRLAVIFEESEKEFTCRLHFPEFQLAAPALLEQGLAPVAELLDPYGGRVNLAMANSGIEIFLTFPRK